MSVNDLLNTASKNKLLSSLPVDELKYILSMMDNVALPLGKMLYEPNKTIQDVYFPTGGIVSLFSIMRSGSCIDVRMVGNDGMLGIPVIFGASSLPYHAMVSIEGAAMTIKAERLKYEFNHSSALKEILLRYTNDLLTHISQSAVCNRFHTVKERLSRLLLLAHDRQDQVTSRGLKVTQEQLSYMLGSRRAGITVAAKMLQQAGLIHYSRGQISIIDRQGLETTACECYWLDKKSLDSLY